MKLINQSYEILGTPQSLEEAWSFVARAARNCYQSEKVRQDESEEDFCKRILLKHPDDLECDHMSPFEFGVIYIKRQLSIDDKKDMRWASKYMLNPFSRYESWLIDYDNVPLEEQVIGQPVNGTVEIYITTNLRVILEHGWEDDLKYAGPPTEHHVKACCFKLITNRAVMAEITRHRTLSFCIESTRYCNYSKAKFGNELTFIKPCWNNVVPEGHINGPIDMTNSYGIDNLQSEEGELAWTFVNHLMICERDYFELLSRTSHPWIAQQAATILPNALKTTIMMCGYEDNLQHMFRLRAEECSGPVHPQMAELMKPLYEDYKKWLNGN